MCCGGSVCVCLSVHREVCVYLPFLHSHTHTPLSCDRINDDEEVLQGGDRQLWQKKIAQRTVCICVCLRNVRISFPQHQRPAHHREVGARCVLFSSGEQRKARNHLFLCATRPCFISQKRIQQNCLLCITWETRENGCNQICK